MRKVVNIISYLFVAFHVATATYCAISGAPREATILAYFGFSLWLITRNRLIEIYNKTCIFWTDCLDNPYDAMVSRIANKIKWGELNKEYLEEI